MKALLRPSSTYGTLNRRHATLKPLLPSSSRSIANYTFAHHAQALSVLPSTVDTSSADFKDNAAQMDEVMGRMQELHSKIEQGGPAKARDKHIARGKMLVREYVQASDGELMSPSNNTHILL